MLKQRLQLDDYVKRKGGKLSSGRRNEIELLTYFLTRALDHVDITDKDIEEYFENSESGAHSEKLSIGAFNPFKHVNGLNALYQSKVWRGVHVHMYEEGVMMGTVPYNALLEGMPKSIVEFLAKQLFKGVDRDIIVKMWNDVNHPAVRDFL